ncbi:uncharacterized protein LOC110183106 [Drosophila serrata]|uniref:uncharacterized protein LOC110183106 n=1 Tax=Drosophila serrata TaxID=7274 RepID=UPI000A1D029C|nr:uncharacterized protein LOC110183106 [Drosophila serrata]
MKFILLCPAVLLLLAAPAKTLPTALAKSRITYIYTIPAPSPDKGDKGDKEAPTPNPEIVHLQKRLDEAEVESNTLKKQNTILEDMLEWTQSKMAKLVQEKADLSLDLKNTKLELHKAEYKLKKQGKTDRPGNS